MLTFLHSSNLLGAGFVVAGFEGPAPPEEEDKKKTSSW